MPVFIRRPAICPKSLEIDFFFDYPPPKAIWKNADKAFPACFPAFPVFPILLSLPVACSGGGDGGGSGEDGKTSSESGTLYVKASNTGAGDLFGISVSLRDDTGLLAVGASGEDGNATGIDGGPSNDLSSDSGAVYVFDRNGNTWSQRAYVKAPDTGRSDNFGVSVSLNGNGEKLAVGANWEDGSSAGLGGAHDDASPDAGAVYLWPASP